MSAQPAGERSKTTVLTFRDRHREGRPLALVTAYDFPTARAADEAGVDAILVGDSLAMVVLGHPNTLAGDDGRDAAPRARGQPRRVAGAARSATCRS